MASGCGSCDPEDEARALAGPDALDCGYAALGEDSSTVRICFESALDAGLGAFAGFQLEGIDSEVRRYYATGPDGDFVLAYDGDPSGGGGSDPVLTVFVCDTPFERAEDGYGCLSSESYALCD